MKKFIGNILIFLVILSTVTAAVNFIYGKITNVDPSTNKFSSIPDTIQICNFGTSHGMQGFNYEDFESDYDCFNFGLTSQLPSYDYRLFQYYGDHIVEGTVVFIPVSYISLFGKNEVDSGEFFAKNKRYYSILPASLIKEYDSEIGIFVKFLPALTSSTHDLVLTLLGRSEAAYDKTWRAVGTAASISRSATGRSIAQAGSKDFYYDEDGNRIENHEEIDALYALIKGCQEKGAIPILLTTPFTREFTDAVRENAPDFYDHYYLIIDRITRDTGVEYYDYAFDERFVSAYSWFRNADHLNKEGARNFTNILMEEVVYANGYLDK